MKLAVLFSGGKDSALAMHKARQLHDVECLVSLVSENPESYMFHVPNVALTKMQAEAMGLPLIQKKTKGEKEKELADLKEALAEAREKFGVEGVVTGAIRSVYQSTRIQKICNELELWCFNPLWLKEPAEVLEEVAGQGFRVLITGVFAYPLDEWFLGREIDGEVMEKLEGLREKYDVNPAGEGGEIETTVLDAPFFNKKIEVLEHRTRYEKNSGVFEIRKARLAGK